MKQKKARLVLPLAAMLWAGLALAGAGAAGDLPRGTPVDAVACADDAGQSYALYLPSAYDPNRRWPIIYFFEPGARGPLPIRLFQAAAEKYGYIIACSNNSRNGPWEPSRLALRAVWADTRRRFSIDEDRVYSAGYSGGAKVALLFGLFLERPWAGVISCCGGLPERMPVESFPGELATFIATGLYDFNYWPSRDIAEAMKARGLAQRLQVFPGGHAWMPGEVAMDAVSWLELQAMKRGKQKKNEPWIAFQFEARLRRAREIEKAGSSVEAQEEYLALATDFSGLIDVGQAQISVARLGGPDKMKKRGEALQAAGKEEMRRFFRVAGALAAFANATSVRERLNLLEVLGIADLRRERGDAGAAGLTAERLLRYLFMEAANLSQQAYGRGEYKKAGALIELAVLVDPGHGQAWFNLACIRSRLGEKKGALRALKTAIRNGMRDLDAVEKDPDLDTLRGEAAYPRLLAALKKSLAEKKP